VEVELECISYPLVGGWLWQCAYNYSRVSVILMSLVLLGSLLIQLTFYLPVTSELIHATVSHGSGTTAEQLPLIQILVPHIMGLNEQLKDPSKV